MTEIKRTSGNSVICIIFFLAFFLLTDVAWQPWKFDAAAHGGERGASASACRPADGAAAAQGAHGGGALAMPSRRSAQGPKAGGGAAVQAAAALLHSRGTREGQGTAPRRQRGRRWVPYCGGGRPTAGEASSAGERGRRCRPWMNYPENDRKKENEGEIVKR